MKERKIQGKLRHLQTARLLSNYIKEKSTPQNKTMTGKHKVNTINIILKETPVFFSLCISFPCVSHNTCIYQKHLGRQNNIQIKRYFKFTQEIMMDEKGGKFNDSAWTLV